MGGLVNSVTKGIFGDPADTAAPLRKFRPAAFSTRGLSGQFDKKTNTFNLTPSTGLTDAQNQVQQAFGQRGQEFRNLIPGAKEGFASLTEAGVNRLGDKRRRAIGNLRENLSRRRVAGSSFAEDAASRAEAEFAREEEDFRAQTALQEIDATARLIDMSTQSEIQGFQTALDQLNFESQLGAQLSSQATSAMQRNAEMQSQILADFAGARGALVGTAIGAGVQLATGEGA